MIESESTALVQSITQLLTLLGIDFWSLGGVEEGGVISVHDEFTNDAIRKIIDIAYNRKRVGSRIEP